VAKRGFRTIPLELPQAGKVLIYTSARVADVLEDIVGEMPVWEGVQVLSLLQAAYQQGTKDGARAAFDAIDAANTAAKKSIRYKNPGRPRKPS